MTTQAAMEGRAMCASEWLLRAGPIARKLNEEARKEAMTFDKPKGENL